MATYIPSQKPSKLDTAGEAITNLQVTFFHRSKLMDVPVNADQQELWANSGCNFENLPEVMNDEDGWRNRISEIRAVSMT